MLLCGMPNKKMYLKDMCRFWKRYSEKLGLQVINTDKVCLKPINPKLV